MNKELGFLLKSAFLNRRTGAISSELSEVSLVLGERRSVAVLFLDLSGFTAFSETLDHETVHHITKSLMDELVITAEQYSGYVDKIEGDRIMVLFGAIRSSENNSRSAILCGFKMLKVIEIASSILFEAGVRLSARIGINSGPVTVAPDAIGHLTAMGNTVNIASRMEEKAGENSILVTDTVYSKCSENILWDESRKVSIRGIGVPIISWKPLAVNYRNNVISCHESVRTVFVGREMEYVHLLETGKMQLDRASGKNRMGGARHLIVELTGEAGSGKTRLVSEFLKKEYLTEKTLVLRGNSIPDAQPAHWLWSALLQNLLNLKIDSNITYNVFSDALSRFCPIDKLSGAMPFLGRLVSAISDDNRLQELDDKAIVSETKMAVRDLLESLSENYKLTIVLEDLQWMDSTDADILDFIVKNCFSAYPIIFLLIRRSDHKNLLPVDICSNSAYSICKQITLNEFEARETREFTEKFTQELNENIPYPVSTGVVEFVHKHSSGNPFFLQELLLHLVESGGFSLRKGTWSLVDSSVEFSTPGSLTGLLQSRLDRLPDKLRKVLLNCSVFGMEFRLDIYRSFENKLGISPCDNEVFNDLVKRQFLEKTNSDQYSILSFHHSFVQSTSYNSILSQNLKILHKAVALAMEEVFDPDAERISAKIAEHWERAGEESSAVKWGIIAQKHASQNYQYEAVLKWGKKLDKWLSPNLDNNETIMKLLTVLHEISKVLQFVHNWDELQTLLDRMLEISSTHNLTEWVARTEIAMGSYYTAVRDVDNALIHLQKSLTMSKQSGFTEIESDTLCSLGVIAGMHREFDKAGEYFKRARDLFSDLQNRKGKARALGNLGILHRNMGESDKAVPLLEEILQLFQEIGDVRSEAVTLGNLGSMQDDLGYSDKAQSLYGNAISIFHRLGDRIPEGIFLCNLGNVLRAKNQFPEARDSYLEAIDIMEEIGERRTHAWILTNLGLLCISEGNPEDSENIYSKALLVFTEIGDEENQAVALAGLGYVQFLSGKKELALDSYVKTHKLISKLKLAPSNFEKTFAKLHRELIAINHIESSSAVPWPEHWKQSEQ